MKPKTAFEKKVVQLLGSIQPLNDDQKAWGCNQLFNNWGILQKSKSECLECGYSWKSDSRLLLSLLSPCCPNCAKELKMEKTRERIKQESAYFSIFQTINKLQVIRTIYVKKYAKIGQSPTLSAIEVMQHWIKPDGKFCVISKNVNNMSWQYDQWLENSDLELRSASSERALLRNSLVSDVVYPIKRIIPEIKRNGFKGKYYGISPLNLFSTLLSDTKAETLIKMNQISMLQYYCKQHSHDVFDSIWSSVKICLRNNYLIKDAGIWVDYIQLLRRHNKDLLNSFYVCPADLKLSHNILVSKERKIQERINEERRIEKIQDSNVTQEVFEKEKSKFFGICFSNGTIEVSVLKSIKEFELEGNTLSHCVHTNEYYAKRHTLVLSARINNVAIETVEVSLVSLKILQSRGFDNKATKYNQEIISLVNSNIDKIAKIVRR